MEGAKLVEMSREQLEAQLTEVNKHRDELTAQARELAKAINAKDAQKKFADMPEAERNELIRLAKEHAEKANVVTPPTETAAPKPPAQTVVVDRPIGSNEKIDMGTATTTTKRK